MGSISKKRIVLVAYRGKPAGRSQRAAPTSPLEALTVGFAPRARHRRARQGYTAAMDTNRSPVRASRVASAALLGLFLSLPAWGQWQWIDATGRKVFSDTAPPASIPEKDILKRPGAGAPVVAPASVPATTAAAPAAAPVAAPQISGRDAELEARKNEAEAAEQARKKAEQAKLAQVRADNCARAKQSRALFDSGVRVATTNAKGEREVMNDQARAAEVRRIDQIIQSDCSPMPQ